MRKCLVNSLCWLNLKATVGSKVRQPQRWRRMGPGSRRLSKFILGRFPSSCVRLEFILHCSVGTKTKCVLKTASVLAHKQEIYLWVFIFSDISPSKSVWAWMKAAGKWHVFCELPFFWKCFLHIFLECFAVFKCSMKSVCITDIHWLLSKHAWKELQH